MKSTIDEHADFSCCFHFLRLQGNLMVTLSFDYSDSLCKEEIEALNAKYGVLISWRDKSKNTGKSIAIRGKEKFIG